MRLNLRKKDKVSTERRPSKTVDDYTCINGKSLSEQTIYDYAQFIPHWDTRKEIGDECFVVRCVNPYNHKNMDEHPSMMISKGEKKNVVIHCRLESCPDIQILEYFKERLIGEVDAPRSNVRDPKKYKADKNGNVFFKTRHGTPFPVPISVLNKLKEGSQ